MKRYWSMEPPQFAFGVMSRSKQITWENLELRDPAFIKEIHRWFAQRVRAQGFELDLENPPVPMFTPFRLRDMVLENRVVVSPMDQYSAIDGVPGDWHFVHLGSRAIGGAGLVYVEMTCPSPEARISPGRHRAVERDPARRLQAHRRVLPCQFQGEAVHAARPFGPQGLHAARLGAHGPSAGERQLAGDLGFADSVLRGHLAGAARSDPADMKGSPRIRKINPLRRRGRLRHARAAHGARLSARQLHFAADEPADGRLRRDDRESHALPAGGVPRLPRRMAAGKAHVGAHLGHRLGAGRPLGGGAHRAHADAEAGRAAISSIARPGRPCLTSGRCTGGCTRRRTPTGYATRSASRR